MINFTVNPSGWLRCVQQVTYLLDTAQCGFFSYVLGIGDNYNQTWVAQRSADHTPMH